MDEGIPRRLRRFYRNEPDNEAGVQDENVGSVGESTSGPRKETPSNENYQQLRDHTRSEAIALALREVKRFMEQNRRLPRENERDEIAENLYSQLREDLPTSSKTSEKGSLSVAQRATERRARASEEKEVFEKEPATIPSNTETNTNGSANAPTTSMGLDLRGLMLDDPLLGGKGASSSGGDYSDNLMVEKKDVNNSCPHCQVKTDTIVYCPNCGNGFCPNCAKSAKSEGDRTNYTCPICSHSFSSRKHA